MNFMFKNCLIKIKAHSLIATNAHTFQLPTYLLFWFPSSTFKYFWIMCYSCNIIGDAHLKNT